MARERVPDRRESITQKFKILSLDNPTSMYVTVGFKKDGEPGEVKIIISNTGSRSRAYTDALSYAISIGMQHGVPLDAFVKQFVWTKFMPCGPVKGYDPIRFCWSPLDLAFRWLGIEFCDRTDLSNDESGKMVKTENGL